jgi:hypothetical protein
MHDEAGTTLFTIHIGAELGPDWRDWFNGATLVVRPDGTAVITVAVRDQAMLYGLLLRIRDLGVPLLGLTSSRTLP